MSSKRPDRNAKRSARRARDAEWCKVRLVLLRMHHGWTEESIADTKRNHPTLQMLRSFLHRDPALEYLVRPKLY